jgi:hypothetical protein
MEVAAMMTKMVPDNLNVQVDLADFWKAWSDGAPLSTLTPTDLHEAKAALLAANVPPATAYAYFNRLAGIIANTVETEWEHFREIELIEDELQEGIEY